ncbi:hypothetical protein [Paenibacillus kandeliae]|uniref:hypothetical protein n=1 Tax=Paenibacillus kandeliae TaxID=3231269 RepID=UPI00345B0B6F
MQKVAEYALAEESPQRRTGDNTRLLAQSSFITGLSRWRPISPRACSMYFIRHPSLRNLLEAENVMPVKS